MNNEEDADIDLGEIAGGLRDFFTGKGKELDDKQVMNKKGNLTGKRKYYNTEADCYYIIADLVKDMSDNGVNRKHIAEALKNVLKGYV